MKHYKSANLAYLRQIPQIEELLNHPPIQSLLQTCPRMMVLKVIRSILENIRRLPKKELARQDMSYDALAGKVIRQVTDRMQPSLKHVINATGIIIHTGLGRALLSKETEESLIPAARNYCNLEIDLTRGERNDRNEHIEDILCLLTGAEAALVVNNNAAAVLLALNTLASGKEVIVSRGHLVEIGGSFRIPEVMSKSTARLKEIGTTNKTYLRDYEKAITPETAVLLRVHTSNFRMVGFVAEVGLKELVALARKKHLRVVEDLGSGALIKYHDEPTIQQSIKEGADTVTFSGDKLLGGPQAGIIAGKRRPLEMMKKNSLYRALRLDKLRLAALETTLKHYLDENEAVRKIPVLQMIFRPLEEINRLAQELTATLDRTLDANLIRVTIEDGTSQVGGGALPGEEIPTRLIALQPRRISVAELARRLRLDPTPVIGRIYRNKLCLDLRTVQEAEIKILAEVLSKELKD